jgi:hypothetical protein
MPAEAKRPWYYVNRKRFTEVTMFSKQEKRVISIVTACAFGAYSAGQHFEGYLPTPKTVFSIMATANSTSSVGAANIMNLTSFAKIDPPPVIPAKYKYQQG